MTKTIDFCSDSAFIGFVYADCCIGNLICINCDRNAICAYLTAVYGLVAVWTAEGRETDRAHRALRLQRLKVSDREDPFAAIIRCTADAAKADKRTRSNWSRVMRCATAYKPNAEALDRFIRRKGGINACAARFPQR